MSNKTHAAYRLSNGNLIVLHFVGRVPPASTMVVLDDGRVLGAVRSSLEVRS